jgi:predicted phage terminase large subunit-like protein
MAATAKQTRKLDAALVEGFQRHYLMAGFDEAASVAPFHRTMWAEACDESKKHCAWAAPRHHAKSSAITLTFAMAAICFRFRDHLLILSDSEGQAVAQLKEIKNEFEENDELRQDFGFRAFLKETDTEIILEFTDGYQIRLLARGSEQRLRGMKWRGKRPNLVLCDDLEFDEIVLNPERLKKFVDWFYKAVLHVGSMNCLFRVVGTILADNSLLSRLMKDKSWTAHLWSAHRAFDDFSEVLWPDRWPEDKLRAERELAITAGKDDAYSQEMLNRPLADGKQLFLEDDMIEIPFAHYRDWETNPGVRPVVFYTSVDLAVSEESSADFTCFTTGATDNDRNLDVVDVKKDRWNSRDTVDKFFEVHEEYEPEGFIVEKGAIQKSILPFLNEEMARRGVYLTLYFVTPSKSKVVRSKSIQARHKARRVRYDHSADWWPAVKQEMTHFSRAPHDDFVDTMSQFGLALDEIITPPTEEEEAEEEWQREKAQSDQQGRNRVTGY